MEGIIYGKIANILSNLPCTFFSEVMNVSTGKWYDCNDSWVKPISSPDTESASAYVLFYVATV